VSTRRCEGPAFTECGAVTDLDRDTAPIPVQFHPERIGFIEDERVVRVIMRSEYVQRFGRRENMTVHVALFARMKSGAKKIFPALQPNSSPPDHPTFTTTCLMMAGLSTP